jgi:AraC-like DNA-binding protein
LIRGHLIKQRYTTGQWIQSIISSFAILGVDTQQVTHGLWDDQQNQLNVGSSAELAAVRTLWHRAEALTQDPLLGLKMGSRQDNRSVGPLAPIIWHSATLRIALDNISRFQCIISEGGTFQFTVDKCDVTPLDVLPCDVIQCEYIPTHSIVPISTHQALALMVGFLGIIKVVSNERVKIRYLELPPSLNARLIAKHLGCDVRSHDGNIKVSFECDSLDQPIVGIDAHLYQLTLAYAEDLLRTKRASLELIHSVKKVIEQDGFSAVTIDHVGSKLGLHKRILQRQLTEQGTSYRQIKENVLKEHSLSLLLREGLDINSVAQQLGYSEPSAFHRAFKIWFGMSPKQFCAKPYYF